MDAGARVCPFCGELPGPGVFCTACGRNLSEVQQLPTRETWERERDGRRFGESSPPRSVADVIGAFLAAMHAAGDPGTVKMRRTEPGFLGRTQYAHGWVVGADGGTEADPHERTEPGRFITVDGDLHRLDSVTRGVSYRGPVYMDVVGPALVDPVDAGHLAGDLAAVVRANGVDDTAL